MLQQLSETVDFLKSKISATPTIGIILGSGLGDLGNEIDAELVIPYSAIPNFPISTVEGHSGNLIFGTLSGKSVVAMQGRFHFYEGYGMDKVVFPVRVMKLMGIKTLFLSNASGGMNPAFKVGDPMILTDHINLFPTNPLIGKNIDEFGPRFPDMSEPYDRTLIAKAEQIAKDNNLLVHKGVYAGVSGPCFETPAEYKYIRIIGADTVGMSTVPEVIAAKHMGLNCFCISVITDLGVEGIVEEVSHEEVQQAAKKAQPKMAIIFKELIASM